MALSDGTCFRVVCTCTFPTCRSRSISFTNQDRNRVQQAATQLKTQLESPHNLRTRRQCSYKASSNPPYTACIASIVTLCVVCKNLPQRPSSQGFIRVLQKLFCLLMQFHLLARNVVQKTQKIHLQHWGPLFFDVGQEVSDHLTMNNPLQQLRLGSEPDQLQEAYLKASRLWVHKNITHVVLSIDATLSSSSQSAVE